LTGTGRLVGLANHILGVTQGFFGDTLPKNALIPDVPIKSVAVWDTVGSLGIPKYAGDQRYDVFRFTDSALSQKVEFGFHAMAVDEQRRDFPVTRWDDRKGVTQIWFVGAHSDVGGGNKKDQSALSDVALDWMISKLGRIGVRFVERAQDMPGAPEGFPAYQTPWKDFPFDTLGTSVRDVLANDRVHVTLPKRWDGAAPPYRPESMQRFREPGLGGLGTDE
jgi:hypothetical protein